MVADSGDVTRRRRGRRGLDVLTDMQKEPSINLQVTEDETPPTGEIDAHLVRTAKRKGWAIMTNDFNLNRIARLEGVAVLNLNELAQAMRPIAIPGEEIVVTVAREGKEPGQGVGSLDDGTMVVVGAPSRLEIAEHEVAALQPRKPVIVKAGGESRQASVRAGLAALGDCDFVLVHDAARPLATAALVRRVLAAAMESGAAFPAIAPRDAVKRVEGNRLVESLDRSLIVLAQTPQGFSYELLARAHREAADAGLVGDDDAQLVAATGHLVTVVPGEPANIKLTTPEDLEVVEALIREHETATRW